MAAGSPSNGIDYPIDPDSKLASTGEAVAEHIRSQFPLAYTQPGRMVPFVHHVLATYIDSRDGQPVSARECWDHFCEVARYWPVMVTQAHADAFAAAWHALRYAQSAPREPSPQLRISEVSTSRFRAMLNARGAVDDSPHGALWQTIGHTMLALLGDPAGDGFITRGNVYRTSLEQIQEMDTIDAGDFSVVVAELVHELWGMLTSTKSPA